MTVAEGDGNPNQPLFSVYWIPLREPVMLFSLEEPIIRSMDPSPHNDVLRERKKLLGVGKNLCGTGEYKMVERWASDVVVGRGRYGVGRKGKSR